MARVCVFTRPIARMRKVIGTTIGPLRAGIARHTTLSGGLVFKVRTRPRVAGLS